MDILNFLALVSIVIIATSGLKHRDFPPYVAVMLVSALYLVTRALNFDSALASINFDVVIFILGFLIMTEAVEQTRLFRRDIRRLLCSVGETRFVFVFTMFFGILSAFLTNDVAAIIGVHVIENITNDEKTKRELLLLLAFSVTVGSVFSPIGNPQNMLIALESGIEHPFTYFASYLLVPSILSLFIIALIFQRRIGTPRLIDIICDKRDGAFQDIATISIFVGTIMMMVVNEVVSILYSITLVDHIGVLPLLGSSIILLVRTDRDKIIERSNWGLVLFFIFMFIAIEGISRSEIIIKTLNTVISIVGICGAIIITSLLLSPIISNVPYVQLFLSYLEDTRTEIPTHYYLLLALTSTIAGNIFPFAAASNIIIIEEAKKKGTTFDTKNYIYLGLILTLIELFLGVTLISF